MPRIKDGFSGQKMLILPDEVNAQAAVSPLMGNLYLTNIGYFPKAGFHYVERKKGNNQYILIYCTEGEGWYKLHGEQASIKAGQYFLLPAGQQHSYGASVDKPWTIYWFHFTGKMAVELWGLYQSRDFPAATIPFSQARIDFFDKLLHTLEKGYSREHLQFTSLALGYLLNSFFFPNIFTEPELKDHDLTDLAIEYMQNNLYRSITLRELADHTGYSIAHLAMEFRKKTGYSAIDYHNRLRIQRASQQLILTGMNIKQISFSLGFKDQYYFSRLFSKITGESPSSYKKNYYTHK